jgi:hypothetical protein
MAADSEERTVNSRLIEADEAFCNVRRVVRRCVSVTNIATFGTNGKLLCGTAPYSLDQVHLRFEVACSLHLAT